MVARGALG